MQRGPPEKFFSAAPPSCIQWQADDNVGVDRSYAIALSTDAGKAFADPDRQYPAATLQSYDWDVPADTSRPAARPSRRVTATDAAGNAQAAASDRLADA